MNDLNSDPKNGPEIDQDAEVEALVSRITERARNLYLTRQLLCTEAVMVSLNRGLNGGLTDDQAVAMSAPFSIALGESGCLCGALSGAVMAVGLFLGNGRPYRNRKASRESARRLHDQFKASHGATCCRALTKQVRHDAKAHFLQCADLTAEAAGMAARLILQKRPELMAHANPEFLKKRQSVFGAAFLRMLHRFSG